MSKGTAIVGFLLCFLGGMALMWGIDRSAGHHGDSVADITADGAVAAGAEGDWSDAAAAVPVTSKDPTWGSRSAPVTVVIFSDFQCPFCSRVNPTIKGLKAKYGADKLRFVWKNYPLPFHKQAMPAHIAAQHVFELGGSTAFWKFHDLAFQNQKALTPDNLETWAEQSGVDRAKFKTAFATNSGKAKVDADMKVAQAAGVRGTPAFMINGVFLSGARPQAAFETEIDKQLAAANKMIGSGVAKDQVYVKLTNINKAKAPAKPEAKGKPKADDKTVWKVGINKGDPIKGPADALVTIIEFSDYECPFCKKVEPTMNKIMDTYKGKVRVVWKDNPLPFHKRALPAAMLAREAWAQKGIDGFWAAHKLLFENNKKLSDEDLSAHAATLGLDVAKANAAIKESKYKAPVAAAQGLAQEINASGTPHFFVNGRRLVGAQPFEKFKTIIDEEIKKADAMVAKGIAKTDLYAEIMKKGKEPPPPEQKDIAAAPKEAPRKGAKDPKVIIHEFSDFECPFCSRVNPTIKQVMSTYADTVQVIWRHKPLPFHKKAPLAHQAAQEAYAQKGDEGFWKMHDKLFASQKKPGIARENLDSFAQELGLDMGKFKAALDGSVHKAFVDGETAASDKVGIRGTPGFVIQPKGAAKGYFVSGAQPFPKFKKLIDRALKEAK